MSLDNAAEYIKALTELHHGLEYKGPGDPAVSHDVLSLLTTLPPQPRIADLGCGSGVSALLLAKYFQSTVVAVDLSALFISELQVNAQQSGLEHLIKAIQGDMAQLNWPEGSVDLLWSEGAAYNLGFEPSLNIWRPFLTNNGIAVISEMSWFQDDPPEPAIAFWQEAYPQMGTESENIKRAQRAGFHLLSTRRLPSEAWWRNYYGPLRQRMKQLDKTPVLDMVIDEMEREMCLFEEFSDYYGYTFYVLQRE